MAKTGWHQAVKIMRDNLVKVEDTTGSGSGVLFSVPQGENYNRCVLTAHHVIKGSLKAKGIITVTPEVDRTQQVKISQWYIASSELHDHALVMFNANKTFPGTQSYDILSSERTFIPGVEIGWMGYPNLNGSSDVACFSHGYISAYLSKEEAYLIDGVSIHGMSGGPAFVCMDNGRIVLAGVVTNYFTNKRPDGSKLPGMAMFRTIKSIQKFYKNKLASV